MAVADVTQGGVKIGQKRSGAASYYVAYEQSATTGRKFIKDIGYTSSVKVLPYDILEPNLDHALIGIYKDPTLTGSAKTDAANVARTEFESFLLHLYANGFTLSGDDGSVKFDLDADMVSNGVYTHYASVNILDFMVLTRAKAQNYKYPDTNVVTNLAKLGPDDTRPNLADVPDQDQTFMRNIIKHVGLKGFLPYLYASEGIDFACLKELILAFFPDDYLTERQTWYQTYLSPILISLSTPMLTNDELSQLGLE